MTILLDYFFYERVQTSYQLSPLSLSSKIFFLSSGRAEFYIKFAPVVENELETECKSAFNGDITLFYSLDHGISWVIIKVVPSLEV